jgi:hypothetical protein
MSQSTDRGFAPVATVLSFIAGIEARFIEYGTLYSCELLYD